MDPELSPTTETALEAAPATAETVLEAAPATIDPNAEVKALAERATLALEAIAKSLFVIESAYVQVLRTSGHKIPG